MEANRSRGHPPKARRWTYAEYMRLPMSGTTRYEVIDDELAVTPAPTSWHQVVVANHMRVLGNFVYEHALGRLLPSPVDVLFGEGDYLQPDVVFVRTDRDELVSERGIEGPPDLVIEILSASTVERDRGIKLERYRHFGVPEYWIVDLDARAVEVWRLAEAVEAPSVVGEGGTFPWTPMPGGPRLDVSVAAVFEGVEPKGG